MQRSLILVYGIVAYLVFLWSFLYAIGFVSGILVPRSINSGPAAPAVTAVLIDLGLLGLFAIQHSVMARPFFKRWWTTLIPPAAERSTYVLLTSLVLFLLYWQWQALPDLVWSFTQPVLAIALWTLFALGWVVVLASTFLINHFDLFGLRQVYLHFKRQPYTPVRFRTPGLYRIVRHPIMVGFLIAFWATPTMSQGHLLFAAVVSAYILIALQLEERDLVQSLGQPYVEYQQEVSMLLPLRTRNIGPGHK